MLCPKCSSENKDTSKFCYICGSDLHSTLPKENSRKSSGLYGEFQESLWQRKQKMTIITILSVVAVVTGVVLVIILSKEKNPPGLAERFEVLGNRLHDNVIERPVPESFGDKKGEYDVLFLLGIPTKFTDNDASIIRSHNISQAEVFECEIKSGGINQAGSHRKTTEYYDDQGLMTKMIIHFLPSEYANHGGAQDYPHFLTYDSNGKILSFTNSNVEGVDNYSYSYTYSEGRLKNFGVEYYPVAANYELRYNENNVLKWIIVELSDEEYGPESSSGYGLLYDDQGKVKRVYPINNDLKPVNGFGYDLQHTKEGVVIKSGDTKEKKVINGQTILHTEIINCDTKGLVTSVLKYENNELKEALIYSYKTGSKK